MSDNKMKTLLFSTVISAGMFTPAFSQNYEDFSKKEKEAFEIETEEMRKNFGKFRDDAFNEFEEFRRGVNVSSTKNTPDSDVKGDKNNTTVRKKESSQKVRKDKNLEWHTTKDGRIDYACGDDNSITMNIRMLNVQLLLPKIYQKDGKYHCGSSVATNVSGVRQMASIKVQNLVASKMVFDDMNECLKNGEQLNKYEAVFYDGFAKNGMARLAKEGIGLNKDGKLVQNNPRGLLPYEKERSGR